MRRYDNACDKILAAAVRVIVRDGVGRLSVDSVASEAGISKGGFFYHFATKASLLAAVTEHLHDEMERAVSRGAASDDWRRAYVEWGVMADTDRMTALLRLRLLAADDNPGGSGDERRTLAPARDWDSGAGLVIRLALEGLWLNRAMGTTPLDDDQRSAVRATLLALVES
ncbi:TetR/AcrR family transcriptional regulator [Fodinicola acaciae]|uniref:TetR/AcrR family transcriptional regulator n=1 Tax=Fodinicola acaciae TaxID=2681555 RepID=UPI0013D80E98|nr:TetR/AcrR family transcriptional regulator [Fodinicola acaciae]